MEDRSEELKRKYENNELLTGNEAAAYCRLPQTKGGRRRLILYAKQGLLRQAHLGRRYLYRREWLDELIDYLADQNKSV